jgi:hypothetical protein
VAAVNLQIVGTAGDRHGRYYHGWGQICYISALHARQVDVKH